MNRVRQALERQLQCPTVFDEGTSMAVQPGQEDSIARIIVTNGPHKVELCVKHTSILRFSILSKIDSLMQPLYRNGAHAVICDSMAFVMNSGIPELDSLVYLRWIDSYLLINRPRVYEQYHDLCAGRAFSISPTEYYLNGYHILASIDSVSGQFRKLEIISPLGKLNAVGFKKHNAMEPTAVF